MFRILISSALLFTVCGSAIAQQSDSVSDRLPHVAHGAITVLGILVAARLALQAFGRAVPVGGVPTFPRYMTSRHLYRLGRWLFALFACSFFVLLVYEHRQVIAVLPYLGWMPESVLKAVKEQSTSYLVVVGAMGAVYLYVLTKEMEWNVLLMMRDVIHSWISVPQLAKQIIVQIRYSLHVPTDAIAPTVADSPAVVAEDFEKDRKTPDRIWAEICYMRWWLRHRQDAAQGATFFAEESFAFDPLMVEFQRAAQDMTTWKAGAVGDLVASNFPQALRDLHNRFSRLVACYLIYRNGSRQRLRGEAAKFGIGLDAPSPENPLRYWVVYVMALIISVYVGVHASAIGYDLFIGKGWVLDQDPVRAQAWIMYSLSNFGLAVVVILLLRYVAMLLGGDTQESHLITYCWTWMIGFLVGPLGLTTAVRMFGPAKYHAMTLVELYYQMLKWGLGPALVSVYISYYLDRQICQDLPDINHSLATVGWRLLNCLGFTTFTVFLLLPYLMSVTADQGAEWDTPKLRFVATGTTFCLIFGMALAAQFALRKRTPVGSGPGLSSAGTHATAPT